jgi:hypothetical protein
MRPSRESESGLPYEVSRETHDGPETPSPHRVDQREFHRAILQEHESAQAVDLRRGRRHGAGSRLGTVVGGTSLAL